MSSRYAVLSFRFYDSCLQVGLYLSWQDFNKGLFSETTAVKFHDKNPIWFRDFHFQAFLKKKNFTALRWATMAEAAVEWWNGKLMGFMMGSLSLAAF